MPSSSPSLPPSVGSSDDSDLSDISLPPSVESNDLISGQCCKKNCGKRISADQAAQLRFNLTKETSLGSQLHHDRVYNKVQEIVKEAGSASITQLRWAINGTPVCRHFWQTCHGVGKRILGIMVKYAVNGHPKLPPNPPKKPRDCTSFYSADIWLLHIYTDMAEAYPAESTEVHHEIIDNTNHPLCSLSVCASGSSSKPLQHMAPKRFLNMSSFKELWALYLHEQDIVQRVSKSTFTRCYKNNWSKYMPLRHEKHHSKCTLCAQLNEERTQCYTQAGVGRKHGHLVHNRNMTRHSQVPLRPVSLQLARRPRQNDRVCNALWIRPKSQRWTSAGPTTLL